jgi:hypothetical protein
VDRRNSRGGRPRGRYARPRSPIIQPVPEHEAVMSPRLRQFGLRRGSYVAVAKCDALFLEPVLHAARNSVIIVASRARCSSMSFRSTATGHCSGRWPGGCSKLHTDGPLAAATARAVTNFRFGQHSQCVSGRRAIVLGELR